MGTRDAVFLPFYSIHAKYRHLKNAEKLAELLTHEAKDNELIAALGTAILWGDGS